MKPVYTYCILIIIVLVLLADPGHAAESSARYDQPVALDIETFEEEGRKYVKAILLEITTDGHMQPLEGEELLFGVERLFGMLPVSEFDFTDGDGSVQVRYPDDLPGDEQGNLVVLVRLDDHPEYGTLEVRETVAWGMSPPAEATGDSRLMLMNESKPMLFSLGYWGGMFVIWGIFFYGVYRLFKMNDALSKN